jgi:formate hydrogenlyase subunit 4
MKPAPSGSHLNVIKLMGKHFIDPKSSEILYIFQVFLCTTQIALFLPKLLPALFLKKPWYPCPFEIQEETLILSLTIHASYRFSVGARHVDQRNSCFMWNKCFILIGSVWPVATLEEPECLLVVTITLGTYIT